MAVLNSHISISILNLNGLNAPIKRHRLANWIKTKTHQYAASRPIITHARIHRLKTKGWRKIYQPNEEKKKAGVAILVSDKIDFKATKTKGDKEGHYIMVKGSI